MLVWPTKGQWLLGMCDKCTWSHSDTKFIFASVFSRNSSFKMQESRICCKITATRWWSSTTAHPGIQSFSCYITAYTCVCFISTWSQSCRLSSRTHSLAQCNANGTVCPHIISLHWDCDMSRVNSWDTVYIKNNKYAILQRMVSIRTLVPFHVIILVQYIKMCSIVLSS